MHLRRNKFLLIILFASGIFTSCQKEIDSTGNTPIPTPIPTPTPVASADDKLKDTVLLYTREIYLWYNQIPATFNPRTYADPDAIMKAIRPFSIESGIQADRFSFAMRQADYNNLSSGISGDFGIGAGFYTTTDLRVTSVERASPAGLAGIRRAWQIIKINGSSNISTSEADLAFLNKAIFGSTQTTFTFLKPDGNTVDITLTATSYQTHPVALDSVYSISSKKIGYMVFKSFLGDITEINNEFNRVFSRFATAGINDVIIDLRYNGGGYVSLAEKLTNYLAPSSATGVMMKQTFNDKNTQRNSSTNFNKVGSVNLPRVFFIVGGGTASASELVINNLKPVMDVKLIGKTTYGKPVGFFPIPVGDWYIFPVSFKTINRSGESNYYNGFSPDADVFDGVTKDFGDITELRLASAIKYITTGAFRVAAGDVYQESPKVKKGNLIFDAYTFKGAISTIR
ncbi:MAG: S41 family peptidase [Chitinophagaceae bacterium]